MNGITETSEKTEQAKAKELSGRVYQAGKKLINPIGMSFTPIQDIKNKVKANLEKGDHEPRFLRMSSPRSRFRWKKSIEVKNGKKARDEKALPRLCDSQDDP